MTFRRVVSSREHTATVFPLALLVRPTSVTRSHARETCALQLSALTPRNAGLKLPQTGKAIRAMKASFELEALELQIHGGPVAGVDEAGRGPLAGPVVAAAIVLDPDNIPEGIADSKTLDPDVRAALYRCILASAQVGIGVAGVDRIDRDNILQASLWAMADAVAQLPCRPRLVLVDGNKVPPRLDCAARAIVKGDARCLSVAAASIVAKAVRDTMMVELARDYPGYGFERHKGYGTAEHHAAIARYGLTPHHRRSFKPVQLALGFADAAGAEGAAAAEA
jgi:ribonuclease HII